MNDFLKVKFCGISHLEDYQTACGLGVDYLGFIFYPLSPRSVDPETVSSWLLSTVYKSHHGIRQIRKVGVFVNRPVHEVLEIQRFLSLDVLQIHGDETTNYLAELSKHLVAERSGVDIWRAFRVGSDSLIKWKDHNFSRQFPLGYPMAKNILLEKKSETQSSSHQQYGGTGKTIEQDVLASIIKRQVEDDGDVLDDKISYVLAGGLRPDNIVELMNTWKLLNNGRATNLQRWPKILDFNSGIEEGESIYRKNPQKMLDVVEKVNDIRKELNLFY